jgi:hypothetical protein
MADINSNRATQMDSVEEGYFYPAITFVSCSCRSIPGNFHWINASGVSLFPSTENLISFLYFLYQ